ncbi:MAG: UDP-N-acetylmuramate dehydrogenase [Candidatus Krumholzibacteriota bacterium]|nr:UDP-N-acetylmuramate dehydrogenase [Candidatus Krumholzibacteriota bacterium]
MRTLAEDLAAAYDGPAAADAPLAPLTRFGLGGPADWLFTPERDDQVGPLLACLHAHGVPVTILGDGTNVLVRDGGVRGAVIRVGRDLAGLTWEDGLARCGAGLPAAVLARRAIEAGRGGFAWAAGLPGSLGGALAGNAGAYGGDMAGATAAVAGYLPDGSPLRIESGALRFSYRRCHLPAGAVVTRVDLRLPPLPPAALPAERECYEAISGKRAAARTAGVRTAGCTFKNPPGEHAGRLIDACGLKGRRRGGARVFAHHANFIEALDETATAADVEALIEEVAAAVARETGVRLEREIRIYGEP